MNSALTTSAFKRWGGLCLADNLCHQWDLLQLFLGPSESFPMSSFRLNPVSLGRQRMSPPWSVGSSDLLVARHLPWEHTVVLQTLTSTNRKPLQIIGEREPAFFPVHTSRCAMRAPFFPCRYQLLHPQGTAVIEIVELGK